MRDVPFTPAEGRADGATVFTCALCGTRFTHGGQACGSCPLHAGCEVVSCPSCGHTFPRSSRLLVWVRRALGRLGIGRASHEERRRW